MLFVKGSALPKSIQPNCYPPSDCEEPLALGPLVENVSVHLPFRVLPMAKSDSCSLLRRAIDATDFSDRAFARRVLNVDERTLRRWLACERRVPGPVIAVSQTIVDHPVIARAMARAVVRLTNKCSRRVKMATVPASI